MPEIRVQVADDVALLVEHLGADEIRQIITAALRERASEELLYDVADDLLAGSELTDERANELATALNRRVADRHRADPVS